MFTMHLTTRKAFPKPSLLFFAKKLIMGIELSGKLTVSGQDRLEKRTWLLKLTEDEGAKS